MKAFLDFLKKFWESLFSPPIEPIKTDEDLPWMRIAKKEVGVKEFPGDAKNPRIAEFHKMADFAGTEDDSWCSSFACFCMEKAGMGSTRSAWARSWLKWGQPIDIPSYGAVVVFWREKKESWKGHVAFFVSQTEAEVLVLGGNQDNAVKVKAYPKSQILGYRWPKNYPLNKS